MEIYNDDCFNILPKLEKDSVDLVVVDLPYNQTACKWDNGIDLNKMWIELKRVCKPNTTFCFFTTTKYGVDLINSNPKWFRYDLVFEKTNAVGFLSANKMPLRIHEMIYIFGKPSGGKKIYNAQKTLGKPYIKINNQPDNKECVYGKIDRTNTINDGSRHPKSIVKATSAYRNTILHPTQKPTALIDFLIKSYSNEGDTIMDFTMGSGTTAVCCKNLNRNFIGVELNKEFYDKAVKRLSEI